MFISKFIYFIIFKDFKENKIQYWNCELEREAQMEVENCVMPSSGAQHKYYRTTIFNFEFDNLTTFLGFNPIFAYN